VTIGGGVTVTRSVADPAGRDAADRWTSATVQQSGRAAKAVGRSFDAAGRLTAQSGIGLTAAGSYGYDPVSGRKTGQSLPLALGGAINDSYAYYAGGRLAAATTNGSTARTTFDEVGNLVGEEIADVSSTVYGYDAANRLTSTATTAAVDGAAPEITYYGWDAANAWRTCQGPDPDPTQANSPVDFSYNAQGRMASYANADAATTASYAYDASGRRTKSVVTVGGTQTTTSYDYDGLTLLSLSATQGATTWRIDYLYDEEGALYGGVYRSPAASASPTHFTAVTDDHGDVLELCDADGAAFAAYRYDAWGLPQGEGNCATGIWTQGTSLITSTLAGQIAARQVLRYASYAYDAESGLYYCSARYYDPATRQWTSGDPVKADGEESAWQYCAGEPVNHADPSGLKPKYRRWGYLEFRLIHSDKGNGPLKKNSPYYVWNHYYGRLTAVTVTHKPTGGTPLRKRRHFPAVSGNNKPQSDDVIDTGPIPGKGSLAGNKGRYPFGFEAGGAYVGFTWNYDTPYSPGDGNSILGTPATTKHDGISGFTEEWVVVRTPKPLRAASDSATAAS